MPSLSLEFEVYCSCGAGLSNQSDTGTGRHGQFITVDPCQKCLEEQYDLGYAKGHDDSEEE